MIGKETWKIGTDRDTMEKLIKYKHARTIS